MQPRPADVVTPGGAEAREKDHTSRLSNTLSNSILSIADVFKDTSHGKTVKFPERLVRVLEQKLQDIAMGKDLVCVSCHPVRSYFDFDRVVRPVITINSFGERWLCSMSSS
jgi:hypothetical protein